MKKILSLLFFIFFVPCVCSIDSSDPTKLFLGSIQFPTTLDFDLCLYYKGQKLDIEPSKSHNSIQFSFLESQYTQEFFIVICNHITCLTEDNTVKNLYTSNNLYKCFKLNGARTYDEQNNPADFTWNVSEYELTHGIIPDNALIFLFNHNLIENLYVRNWTNNKTLRFVPTIIIDSSATQEQLSRAITVARLAALDVDTFHNKKSITHNNSTQALITMMH